MSSPCKKEPAVVVDAVLKRAEVGKMTRKLKTRLALAQFKANRGWQDLTLDTIEPKIEEELRRQRPLSSGDVFSDTSSSGTSELRYPASRTLMSSPLKRPAMFSDQIGPRSGGGSSTAFRKRNHNTSFPQPSSDASSRKRFRSSPLTSRSITSSRTSWADNRFTQSSPTKARKHRHFTTSSGPGLSFYSGSSSIPEELHSSSYSATSDDEEIQLPLHSFDIRQSPPRTPSPVRRRGNLGGRKDRNGRIGEEGADLLLYLATSPSPANPSAARTARAARMEPPSTPPPKALALPSSMMNTPGTGSGGLLSAFGGPTTPSQHFDFSDFVNITPSPAQGAWPRTPKTVKTPATITRRRLSFDDFPSSPISRDQHSSASKPGGLGMKLGGNLIS